MSKSSVKNWLQCLTCLLLCSSAPSIAALPRQAALGVSLRADPGQGTVAPRIAVDEVVDSDLAKRTKLRPGDVLKAIDGRPVTSSADVIGALSARRSGDPSKIEIERAGRRLVLSGQYGSRPLERYVNGAARYGAVPFRGGELRDIIVTPPGGARGPVVFLIQGYTCASMETSGRESAHHQLFEGLLARGISVYRIEKPQAGDSRGGPACGENDFATELAAFEAGYQALMKREDIAADRIFLLGHSLGGVEAPLIAARNPAPRGVAIFGAVARGWADYMLDIVKYQPFLSRGADPAQAEIEGEKLRSIIHRIYTQQETPAAVASTNADNARLLRDWLGWDGKDQLFGRHYRFWQQLSGTPLLPAWRDTRSNVLAVYGESDMAAVDDEDHRLVAEVVNHYRPGTARFVLVPRTGHGMTVDGTATDVRAANRAGPPARNGSFNAELIGLFGDWIEGAMSEPPVADRFSSITKQ
jgi:hypothetical protein